MSEYARARVVFALCHCVCSHVPLWCPFSCEGTLSALSLARQRCLFPKDCDNALVPSFPASPWGQRRLDPEPRALTTSLGLDTLSKRPGQQPVSINNHTYAKARIRVSAYHGNMARSPDPMSKFPCTFSLGLFVWLEEEFNTSITKFQRSRRRPALRAK